MSRLVGRSYGLVLDGIEIERLYGRVLSPHEGICKYKPKIKVRKATLY